MNNPADPSAGADMEDRFLQRGYIIQPSLDRLTLDALRDDIRAMVSEMAGREIEDLSRMHEVVARDKINEIRVGIYNRFNERPDFLDKFYGMAGTYVERIVGNELAAQQKVNLSILMPNDDGSQLKLHSDTMSGQSEYEIVLWVPLTDARETNSMYVMDFDTTRGMWSTLSGFHAEGMDNFYEAYKDKAQFMTVDYGQVMLFTPSLFHGSVVNRTDRTRVSMNVRFKGLFTPYFTGDETEKKLGSFYRPFRIRPASLVGLRHNEPKFG